MKKFLFRFLAVLLGIGAPVMAAEVFLRLDPRLGYRYCSYNFENKDSPMAKVFNKDEWGDNFRPSALLGYEHVPGSRHFNRYGLRGKEYKLKKDENVFRILILGDSLAEQGWSCEKLESLLNDNLGSPRTSRKFEVWNSGVGGYDVRQYYLYFRHRGVKFDPDMVIIFIFMNDFYVNTSIYYKDKRGMIEYYFPVSHLSSFYRPSPFLMKYSYLYRFIALRLDAYFYNKDQSPDDVGEHYLGMIKEACRDKNIPLYIVIFPYLKPFSEYDDNQIREYASINKVTEAMGIDRLNLFPLLSKYDLYRMRDSEEDEIHPNKESHQVIAGMIFQDLMKKELIVR